MKASVGDRIVVASTVVDQPLRDGEVVEVRHPDGSPPYVVQWSDTGERTLVFPGPDARIEHPGGGHPLAPAKVVKTWTVSVTITEEGDTTTATAVLSVDAPQPLDGAGLARRNPGDPAVPVIGDEVAVSRALRHLADHLIDAARTDIGTSTGTPSHLYD